MADEAISDLPAAPAFPNATDIIEGERNPGVSGTSEKLTWDQAAQGSAFTSRFALIGGGGSGISPYGATLWKNGLNFVGTCQVHGTVITSTDFETAWQGLYDHMSAWDGATHTGSVMMMNIDGVTIDTQLISRPVAIGSTSPTPGVSGWPMTVRGQGYRPRPSATTGEVGGTIIRWGSGSPPGGSGLAQGAMLVGLDNHGCRYEYFGLDCNGVARRGAVSAGRQAWWWHIHVREIYAGGFAGSNLTPMTTNLQTVGIGILITNYTDAASDRYVQQRVDYCDFIGSNGGIALVIKSLDNTGSTCTDGRVTQLQANGCNHGAIYFGEGGWSSFDGHWTQNGSGTGGKNWNLMLDAGFLMIHGGYCDIVQDGPGVRILNNNYTINGMFMNTNNKSGTFNGFEIGGQRKGTIMGVTFGGTGNVQYMFNGTGAGPAIVGCMAPAGAAQAVAPANFTRVTNSFVD